MNSSLSTFMKLAATVVVITALIAGSYYLSMKDMTDDLEVYIQSNNAK